LSESKRVLKANGELLHSLIFLNNQTPRLDEVHKLLLTSNVYNLYDKYTNIENLKNLHSVSYKNIDLISIGEDFTKEHTFNSLTKENHKLNVSLVKCS
jgi:ubiquinone/menaquinone biosynthesis C-methylase UbiE